MLNNLGQPGIRERAVGPIICHVEKLEKFVREYRASFPTNKSHKTDASKYLNAGLVDAIKKERGGLIMQRKHGECGCHLCKGKRLARGESHA